MQEVSQSLKGQDDNHSMKRALRGGLGHCRGVKLIICIRAHSTRNRQVLV